MIHVPSISVLHKVDRADPISQLQQWINSQLIAQQKPTKTTLQPSNSLSVVSRAITQTKLATLILSSQSYAIHKASNSDENNSLSLKKNTNQAKKTNTQLPMMWSWNKSVIQCSTR